MGNSASSAGRGHQDDTVDFGHLTPQGLYSGPRDYNETIVGQLIIDRKLAPFYRPLEDYDESWDDEQILAARREPPPPAECDSPARSDTASTTSRLSHHKRNSVSKESSRDPEAALYRDAAECPICFLYYPSNINHSRCCDQAICTECFVQIKRAEPTVTHLVSEPACCPYCVQDNFGVVYTPPPWRAGIGSEGSASPSWPESPKGSPHPLDTINRPGKQKRRKSYGYNDAEVVTTDHIRPDWEAKLAAVRAAAARRANRRIIMRQVGDRLIPVGVTSGRVHALPTEGGGSAEAGEGGGGGGGSRRSRRRQQHPELNNLLGGMGLQGQDLEELMVMEAMRLSLLEHEEQMRKEEEERAKNGGEANGSAETTGAGPSAASSGEPSTESESTATLSPPAATSQPPSVSASVQLLMPTVSATEESMSQTATPMPSAPPSPTTRRAALPTQPSPEIPDGAGTPGNSSTGHSDTPTLPAFPTSPTRPGYSRQDSYASSVNTYDTRDDRSGYGLLPSESEESIVAREPLLHLGDDGRD